MALARLVSAPQARDYYYEKDPIFAPEGKGENSEWFGTQFIHEFELESRIKENAFANLLVGQDPRTGQEIVQVGANSERRGGIDLAFSAPKSVSIAALHLGHDKVTEAHQAAVKKALEFVEKNFIQYRETKNKKTYFVAADNMLTAMFTHSTSRSNDPQLHTHCVIQNIVQTADGSFKAISNELIFQHQKLINNIYQNELALNLQELGYSIDNYSNKFELQGISEEVRETFSKRSKEIDDLCDKIKDKYPELPYEEIREKAVLQSRDNKDVEITQAELKNSWQSQVAREEIQPVMEGFKEAIPRDLVKLSLQELEETDATFSRNELLNAMIAQSRGEHSLKELQEKIDTVIKERKILEMGKHKGHVHYATPEMIETEQSIIARIKAGKNTQQAFLKENIAEKHLSDSLTKGQRAFVKTVLTTTDFLTVIQGDAGTGKTYAVDQVRQILKDHKVETNILGVGFTGKAAQELSEAAKINTSTIASFLSSDKPLTNTTIIVDEASMVGSKDMLQLIEKASGGNNKIILVGDRKQLQAIGAGKMFTELQNENVAQIIDMKEVLRQKTDITKAIVKHISDYQEGHNREGIKAAFEVIEKGGCIEEITSKSKDKENTKLFIQKRAIEEYMTSQDSLLLTASRAEKNAINTRIRSQLFSEEQLANQSTIKTRETINKSYLAADYRLGDKVKKDRKEYTITKIDPNTNTLTLEYRYKNSKNSQVTTVNLFNEQIMAYREEDKKFLTGDKIIFTENNKRLGVQNGLSGIIEKMDKHGNISVALKDGKKVNFNTANYSNIDYGYALTLHKAQGQTCHKAIFVHSADDNVSTESFYVAATRATHEVKVFTPDAEALKKTVTKAQDKTSTREFKETVNTIRREHEELDIN